MGQNSWRWVYNTSIPRFDRYPCMLRVYSERGVLSNAPQVWGVAYDEATSLIYASDMNSGLWILRRTD